MFLFRRRWTVLTAILAAIGYIVRNYDIQGLEAIRFEPRETPALIDSFSQTNDFAETQVPFPKNASPLPGTTANTRTSSTPSTFPNVLPNKLPNTLSNSFPSTAVSPLAGSATANMPSSFPATALNPGQQISLGEKFAVWEESQMPSNSSAIAGTLSRDKQSFRIASFNMQVFGSAKRTKPHVMEVFVKLLRQFEVVALQEICSNQDDLLPELVDRLNQSGRRFDYVVGPRVGRGTSREQFAFLFDTESIETDRYQLYTVDDPQDLLHYEPLVGWFRTKGIPVNEAFTFSLIDVHSHPDFAQQENRSLPDLIRAIERDGRNEDDWIFAGDFGVGGAQLEFLPASGARFALLGIPTDTRGLAMFDNLIFSNQATREFTGRAGVVDFLRQFNLSLEQALEISDHLPVWAEFTVHEGGLPGRVAPQVAPQVAPTTLSSRLLPSAPAIQPTVQFQPR